MAHQSYHHPISENTIGECWLSCIRKVLSEGSTQHDEDIEIREVLGLAVKVLQPLCYDEIIEKYGDRIVISRTLDKFSKGAEMPDRPFTYGARIYNNCGVDQFEWIVNRLESKRETKSASICLLIPGDESPNLPCLTTIDAKIRNEKLELQFFFRSQNIFGRQYANLMALARLQADLAKRCQVEPGEMSGYVASAHIYAFDLPDASKIISGQSTSIRDQYYLQGPKSIRN